MGRHYRAAVKGAMAGGAVMVVSVFALMGRRAAAPTLRAALLSTEYWSQYYADASPLTPYSSSAMPMEVRRPSFYSSDVQVEECIALSTADYATINMEASGHQGAAKLKQILAALAFDKPPDDIRPADLAKIVIKDISILSAASGGVRVEFVVTTPNQEAAEETKKRISAQKLTRLLRNARILPNDANDNPGTANILAVTLSAYATPMFDDNETWGLQNATQNSAYQAYLKRFYRSASAERSRWPWLDDHVIYGELGGSNRYQFSEADAVLDSGDGGHFAEGRGDDMNDVPRLLDAATFYGKGQKGDATVGGRRAQL